MTIAVDRAQPAQVPWWRLPFTAITWRRTAYILVATPVALFGVVATLAGRGRSAQALHHRLLDRLLGPSTDVARRPAAAPAHHGARVALFGLVSLPLNVGAFAVTVYGWSIPPMNLFYPLRAGEPPLDAWGGPSLAGAWAVHALGGVPFAFVTAFAVWGLTTVQARLARRVLS